MRIFSASLPLSVCPRPLTTLPPNNNWSIPDAASPQNARSLTLPVPRAPYVDAYTCGGMNIASSSSGSEDASSVAIPPPARAAFAVRASDGDGDPLFPAVSASAARPGGRTIARGSEECRHAGREPYVADGTRGVSSIAKKPGSRRPLKLSTMRAAGT